MRFNRPILCCALVLGASAGAQTTFHGNNARTGSYAGAGPAEFHRVHWTVNTDGPIFSSPAIADGVVYFGSADRNVYAVDEDSGKQKWVFKSGGPVNSSPAVADGSVFVESYDGRLYALNAATGEKRWEFRTEGERHFQAPGLHGVSPRSQTIFDPFDIFLSSPAVADGVVYFGSGDGNVYAVHAADGSLKWKFKTGDVVHASPAVVDGVVYIGSWDSYLYALDAKTGAEKWRFKTGEDHKIYNQVGLQSSPAVVDGVVYVGCRDAHMYAVDAATGVKKWDYFANYSWINSTPAVANGTVYAGTSDSGRFFAFDSKTGELKYNVQMKPYFFSSAALAGNLAYIGNHNGRVYAIDTRTGQTKWEFQTEASKANAEGMLNPDGSWKQEAFKPFFRDADDMYAYVRASWSVGSILSSPVVNKGRLYFGSTDGKLYAIE